MILRARFASLPDPAFLQLQLSQIGQEADADGASTDRFP